jgi:replication factor C subunit 3/5
MNNKKENIPWVEKYRPTNFDDIVLSEINRDIFKNILDMRYFPNLLFYGPPGTGKTTTIINLINEYQRKYGETNKGSVIHLNASDERGIDIIRNQIFQFVKSKNFFEKGVKFVILDEVDYMTKNAQQALKYLLQSYCYNVRFCLICNYISKIDESLKNEFICIRFNQLPKQDIYKFIKNITVSENLNLSDKVIDTIQNNYNSDIRSMINFIQLNQNITQWEENIITDEIWERIYTILQELDNFTPLSDSNIYDYKYLIQYIHDISIQYNTDKKNILKYYYQYIIRNKKHIITSKYLKKVESIMHFRGSNIEHILLYFSTPLKN